MKRNAYAQIFAVKGAKAFSASGALARMPMSTMSLGMVLAIQHLYGNWTLAGIVSALFIMSAALVTPVYARLFDRLGQTRVGSVALVAQVLSMIAVAVGLLAHVPPAAVIALAILCGLTQFTFGALVRTRWAYVLADKDDALLNTAYAFEAAVDEIVFIIGPVLTAAMAASIHPVSQLLLPIICAAVGGTIFFCLKNTQPPVLKPVEVHVSDQQRSGSLHRATQKPTNVLLVAGVLPLIAVYITFNMSFNAFDVSITAAMTALHLENLVGVQLALVALGSCIGAFLFGMRKQSGAHWKHLVVYLALLMLGFIGMRLSMDNLLLLGILEVLSGLVVSPIFATGNLIIRQSVPAGSLTEGLSWLSTAGAAGTSIGASISGVVIDHAGPHSSMMIPWIAVLISLILALFGWNLARKRDLATQIHHD